MAVGRKDAMAKNGGVNGDVQSYQVEVLEKVRGIHGTVSEIKSTLAQTHQLTKEIHERITKKPAD